MKHQRNGFSLIELLVVVAIIAILAGLLLPAVTLVRNKASQSACGNNQRQIATAMVSYAYDNEGIYPIYLGSITDSDVTNADGFLATKMSAELVAIFQSLPGAVFRCRSEIGQPITDAPRLIPDPTDLWANKGVFSYAYEWTVPAECASYKIILADRTAFHTGKVVMASHDGSVRAERATLFAGAASSAAFTSGAQDAFGMCANPDALGNEAIPGDTTPDNIYSHIGDQAGPVLGDNGNRDRQEGNPRRSWVK